MYTSSDWKSPVQILRKVSIIAAWMLVVVMGILIVGYVAASIMIGLGIDKESRSAMKRFSGDRIEALISVVDCQDCGFEDRNHAVWTLGQLRDKRALPVLYKYRTGKPCDHSRQICQYEISKAVRWTEGNAFMLPQLWRVMVRDDRRPAANSNPS